MKKMSTASKLFNFLRGALRGLYGIENFREHKVLIVGVSLIGQQLLNRLCVSGGSVEFSEPGLKNYHRTFTICKEASPYEGTPVSILVDLTNNYVCIQGKCFPIDEIQEDAYTQGIHEFYFYRGKFVKGNGSDTSPNANSPTTSRVFGGDRHNCPEM